MSVRGWLHALLTAVLAMAPAVPPQHAHAVEDNGAHHLVLHRHAQPHDHEGAGATDHGHDGVVDHDGNPLLTLDAAFTLRGPQHDIMPATVEPVVGGGLRPVGSSVGASGAAQLIHAPPRGPTPPRAPPSLPTL